MVSKVKLVKKDFTNFCLALVYEEQDGEAASFRMLPSTFEELLKLVGPVLRRMPY